MIELKEISKIYTIGDETVYALDHASMSIQEGEFVSIIGPSGSGKSTMMNIIGCLDVADEGEYILDGISIIRNGSWPGYAIISWGLSFRILISCPGLLQRKMLNCLFCTRESKQQKERRESVKLWKR